MDAFCLFICLSAYSVVDYLIKSSDINDIPESIRVVVTRDKPMLKLISVSKQLFNIWPRAFAPCLVTLLYSNKNISSMRLITTFAVLPLSYFKLGFEV